MGPTAWFADRHSLSVRGLQLSWIAVVFWFELGTFRHVLSSCTWPSPQFPMTGDERTSHILLIADPQVLDAHSYPDRSSWLTFLIQFIINLNMRKSWRLVALKLKPHVVVFLGNMIGSGKEDIADDEYEAYYARFKSIFKLPYSPLPVYYIPGNYDTRKSKLGLSSPSAHATTQYTSHFGPLNNQISIANHTLLFIDAPGLIEEDQQRQQHGYNYEQWTAIPDGPIDYVKHFITEKRVKPTVLFSHLPLSRPDGISCGSVKEKGTVTELDHTLSDEASRFLLQNIRPSIIFSGNNHDHCSITHSLPPRKDDPTHKHAEADEISVKSFSLATGVKRPGFQLLSLVSPSPDQAQLHVPCQLPNQLGVYQWVYLPLLILSLLGLVVLNVYRIRASQISRTKTPSARTNEDAEEEANIGVTSAPFGGREKLEVEDGTHGRRLSASGPASVSECKWGGSNGYENIYENGNGDGAARPVHFLPAPVSPRSTNHIRQQQQPSQRGGDFACAFVLGNQRCRFFISPISEIPRYLVECAKGRTGRRGGRDEEKEKAGFVQSLVNDLVSVAWPPLGMFVVITLWTFR